jgi:hypothetical protein
MNDASFFSFEISALGISREGKEQGLHFFLANGKFPKGIGILSRETGGAKPYVNEI